MCLKFQLTIISQPPTVAKATCKASSWEFFFGYGCKMSQRQQIPEMTLDGFQGKLQFPANNLGDKQDELALSNGCEKRIARIGEFVVFDTSVDRSICINE